MVIFFAFDNDDMESLKCRVTFLSLIFLLKRIFNLFYYELQFVPLNSNIYAIKYLIKNE